MAESEVISVDWCGNDEDGGRIYVRAGSDGYWSDVVIDSGTGHFTQKIQTSGPHNTYAEALDAGWTAAYDWCIDNEVLPDTEYPDPGEE